MWDTWIYIKRCLSTQDWAMAYTQAGKAPLTGLVLTDSQTQGRGQRGRKWLSAKGETLCVTYWMPVAENDLMRRCAWIGIGMALSAQSALNEWAIKPICLKWPNDIYAGHRKIGGLLVEVKKNQRGQRLAYMGLGLNVNTGNVLGKGLAATSLAALSGHAWDMDEVLVRYTRIWGKYAQRWQKSKDIAAVWRREYEAVLWGKDQWLTYESKAEGRFEGRVLGIDNQAALRLQTQTQGEKRFLPSQIKCLAERPLY